MFDTKKVSDTINVTVDDDPAVVEASQALREVSAQRSDLIPEGPKLTQKADAAWKTAHEARRRHGEASERYHSARREAAEAEHALSEHHQKTEGLDKVVSRLEQKLQVAREEASAASEEEICTWLRAKTHELAEVLPEVMRLNSEIAAVRAKVSRYNAQRIAGKIDLGGVGAFEPLEGKEEKARSYVERVQAS